MIVKSKYNISKDDYNKLLNCSKEEVEEYIVSIANKSPYPACGYGFYSHTFFKEDDNYFVSWEHWDSCD